MQREEIVQIVNQFFVEEFEIDADALKPEAQLVQDLGIESLDFVDIVVIIEKEFGFKVKREEMINVRTLDDMYKYIEERV
jgi:acyl carrier protein